MRETISTLWSNNFSCFLEFGSDAVPFSALPILATSHVSIPVSWPDSVKLVNRVMFNLATQEELERLADMKGMFSLWHSVDQRQKGGPFRFPPGLEKEFVGGLLSSQGDLPEFWQEKILFTENSIVPSKFDLSALRLNRVIVRLDDESQIRVGPEPFRRLIEQKIRRQQIEQQASKPAFDADALEKAQLSFLMRYLRRVIISWRQFLLTQPGL